MSIVIYRAADSRQPAFIRGTENKIIFIIYSSLMEYTLAIEPHFRGSDVNFKGRCTLHNICLKLWHRVSTYRALTSG